MTIQLTLPNEEPIPLSNYASNRRVKDERESLSRDKYGMIKSSALLGFSSVAILAISTLGIPEPARLPLAIFLAVLYFAFAIPFLALRVLAFLMLDEKFDERVNYNLG